MNPKYSKPSRELWKQIPCNFAVEVYQGTCDTNFPSSVMVCLHYCSIVTPIMNDPLRIRLVKFLPLHLWEKTVHMKSKQTS